MKICAMPECTKEVAVYRSKDRGLVKRRWCYHHLDGAGEHERKRFAKIQVLVNSNLRHGMSKTRPYRIWQQLKKRCDKPRDISYKWYGGKGITYPQHWKSFEGFWGDMQDGYKDDLTIDRIDGNKSYSKENCRWATPLQQTLNRLV